MANLFDMLGEMQGGAALNQMGQQFGLSRQEMERAMAALTPAFSEGLRRNVDDPQGFGRFVEALGRSNHANYVDDPARAFEEKGMKEGNAILGHLFKSKNLSRAVAAEASQASGLSQGILKQLLPILAPMILGGLFKQITGGGGSGNNPLGQILEQITGGATRRQTPGSGNNPIGDILEQMTGGGSNRGGRRSNPVDADNPLGKIFEEMLGGQQPQQTRRREPAGRKPQGGGLSDIFGDMFSPGGQSNENYNRQMETTFDEFLGGRRN